MEYGIYSAWVDMATPGLTNTFLLKKLEKDMLSRNAKVGSFKKNSFGIKFQASANFRFSGHLKLKFFLKSSIPTLFSV